MSVLVVVQSRMNSTRLPGKVRMDICGFTMEQHVVYRAQKIGWTIIADPADYPMIPEDDVLSRFVAVAVSNPEVETFVRLTADCPMLDVGIARSLLWQFEQGGCDILSTSCRLDGIDVQIFSRAALMEAHLHAKGRRDREHVTPWMIQNLSPVIVDYAGPALRWSVDTQGDLDFVRTVFGACALCGAGVPHHSNASGSISGSDRHPLWDLHHVENGGLAECTAYDILMSRTGGDAYVSI